MKNTIRIMSTVIVLALAGGVCRAQLLPQPGPGGPAGDAAGGRGRDAMLEKILDNPELVQKLGLSEKQVAGLKEGMFEMRKEQIRLQADLKLAALEQAKLVQDPDASEADIMEAVEKTGGIRTEIAKLHMRRLIMVRKTLTAEQQEKVRAIVRRHIRKRAKDLHGLGTQGRREWLRDRPNQEGRPGERGPAPRPRGPEGAVHPPEHRHPEGIPPPEPEG